MTQMLHIWLRSRNKGKKLVKITLKSFQKASKLQLQYKSFEIFRGCMHAP